MPGALLLLEDMSADEGPGVLPAWRAEVSNKVICVMFQMISPNLNKPDLENVITEIIF